MLSAAVCCGVSCGKFLDERPQSDFTQLAGEPLEAFSGVEEAESGLSGAYSKFLTDLYQLNNYLMGDVTSDNCYVGGDGVSEAQFDKLDISPANSIVSLSWKQYYELAGTATWVLERVLLMEDDPATCNERKRIEAEARFIRAWAYFDIVRLWGDAPMSQKTITDMNSSVQEDWYPLLYPERTPAEEIYSVILDDLSDTYISALRSCPSGCFKATKGAAHGLKAKVCATMGNKEDRDYEKVVEECDKVISEGYRLVGDFDTLWRPGVRHTSESIFELEFSETGKRNWACWVLLTDIDGTISVSWRRYCTPSHEFLAKFDREHDRRYAASVCWAEVPYSIYWPSENYPLSYKIRSRASDIILMRLADILLLKAEALVELGRPGEAADIVDEIRARAGVPPLPDGLGQDKMRLAVENERQLELYMEGQRWFDLLRNGRMEEVMQDAVDHNGDKMIQDASRLRRLMPVPQDQIDINGNLTQNEGY